jgi:hypothetical protein
MREVLELVARRLSPDDHYVGTAVAEITVLRDIAGNVTGEARTDILKAVAILTDRVIKSRRTVRKRQPIDCVQCVGEHLNVMDAAPTGDDMLDGFSFRDTNSNCLPM